MVHLPQPLNRKAPMSEEQACEIIKLLEAIEKNTANAAKVLCDAKEYPLNSPIGVVDCS